MWNEYYRLTTELVKGVAAPLPTSHPFYVLLEASGSDAERIRSDLEAMLETALEPGIILDATIASSGAAAAAIWKIRDSSVELGRAIGPNGVGFDISLAIGEMQAFADTVNRELKEKIDQAAYAIVFGHAGDGNLHVNARYSPAVDKYEEVSKLVYGITADFAGSISAEHGIGLLKRPYLKLSRTEEEIETMRTLKRALDPHGILNPGRIFRVVAAKARRPPLVMAGLDPASRLFAKRTTRDARSQAPAADSLRAIGRAESLYAAACSRGW